MSDIKVYHILTCIYDTHELGVSCTNSFYGKSRHSQLYVTVHGTSHMTCDNASCHIHGLGVLRVKYFLMEIPAIPECMLRYTKRVM